jgi:SAM-dependent methyltransferase
VDFSAEAVAQASRLARQLRADAEFRVGELAATGLGPRSVDAVMCVDSIQFAVDPGAAFAEIRRVLTHGGRVVMTGWEPVQPDDDRLIERLRRVDLEAGLRAAGFDDVEVHERPDWRSAELRMWEEAAGLDPGDDPALLSFRDEAVRTLASASLVRRVMAVATAP